MLFRSGASGALLTAMIQAAGLVRTDAYIANIVKCRPPRNRTPTEQEAQTCLPFLRRQMEMIRPKFVVALGGTASKYLIGPEVRIRRDHGRWSEVGGLMIMPTFHPSALLRDPSQKRDAWSDFQAVAARLGEYEKGQQSQ